MQSKNPYLQFTHNRAIKALSRIKHETWRRIATLEVEATTPSATHSGIDTAQRMALSGATIGQTWGKLYDQRWCKVAVPPTSENRESRKYLEWRDQAEATLYVDGVPYYGFDVAHRRVALPNDARSLWVESICVQSAIWHPEATGLSDEGSVFGGAFHTERNDEAWNAYHDLKCLIDLISVENPDSKSGSDKANFFTCPPKQRQLLRALDELCDAYEVSGLTALRDKAQNIYRQFRCSGPALHATLTGHAHIDLVWLWPERVGEAKATHTFATATRLMSLYPEFRFAYSQPASYAAVERREPKLFETVKQKIAEGQWQATGALYVESDTQLPCGEALARSFVIGQDEFARIRGQRSSVLWLPDVFGYSACLPQLMLLSGVPNFFTTKLTWNLINRFPHSSFIWRGNDGSEVLAHVTQGCGYNNSADTGELRGAANAHTQSDVHREMLHPTGYGDGGGGPTEEMCERVRRLSALSEMPSMSWGHPEEFFERLAPLKDKLPVHYGECYLERHRGTYTTHGKVKAAFRAMEAALQTREAVAVVTEESPDLNPPWKRMIFAQFHDYIPGSSVPDVYNEGVPEMCEQTSTLLADSSRRLNKSVGESCVFNPTPLKRLVRHQDKILSLPPLSGVPTDHAVIENLIPVSGNESHLTNGRTTIRINPNGDLDHLAFHQAEVPMPPQNGKLVLYPDRPNSFDPWDIDRHTLSLGQPLSSKAEISADIGPNGVEGAISIQRKIGEASSIEIRYGLLAGADYVLIDIHIDWEESETLLKLHFETGFAGLNVRCGAPFGSLLRPQQPVSPQAGAMWEMPASRYVIAVNDAGDKGMAVISENKYGFSARNGNIGVSLLRSPKMTGFEAHQGVYPENLLRNRQHSIYSDLGPHHIRLALAPYSISAPRESHPTALADTLFAPIIPYLGTPVSAPGWQGLKGGDTLIPSWALPANSAGAWILRLHETAGAQGIAGLQLAPGWEAQKVDLLEQPLEPPANQGILAYRPYEIISLRMRPETH